MWRSEIKGNDGDSESSTKRRHVVTAWSGRRLPIRAALVAALVVAAGVVLWMLPARPPAPQTRSSAAPEEVASRPAGLPGAEWLIRYANLVPDDDAARHLLVLEQVAQGNIPDTWDDWATITVRGRRGTVVEFEVSPHGLRIGTTADWVEVPLDGPHSAAAAEILGYQLCTAWMVDQVYAEARKHGGTVHYFAAAEIADSLRLSGWKRDAPDGEMMKSPEFFQQRSTLLQNWLNEHGTASDTLIAGYFKTVVPPIDGLTRRGGLEMVGGHDDQGERIQSLSGGFHPKSFFDYSHNIRLAKNTIRVQGRPVTLHEFWSSVQYAVEFGFRRTLLPERAYPYPPALGLWMERNGYLKYPLDAEASKATPGPTRG